MSDARVKVLLVEDSPTDAQLLCESLQSYPLQQFEIAHVERLEEAVGRLAGESFDAILLDLNLPDSRGIRTCERMSHAAEQTPIIILTGADDESIAAEAMHLGIQDYVVKGHMPGSVIGRTLRYAVERSRSQRALQESEERYRTLFTNMSEAFALGEAVFHDDGTACDFCFLEINDAFERQTGLTREILGRPMTEVLPNLEQHWIDTYCGVARTGRSARFVSYNKDTGRHYDVFCYSPAKSRFAILFRDVTATREAQEALRSVAQFPEENPSPVLRVARDGTLLYANAHSASLLDLWNCQVGQMVPEEIRGHIAHTLDAGKVREAEIVCGEVVYSFSIAPIASEGYVNLYGRDITDRKRAEEALRESEQWFRTLANMMPQLVWTADPDGRVDYYNERYKEYRGIEPTTDGSFRWAPVLHGEDVAPTVEVWERAVRTGETYQIEHRVQRADGSYHWHLSRGMPVRDSEGRIVKWFGTATDIDDLKRAQEALRQSESFYRQTLESIPGMVFTTRPDGYCDYQSQQWVDYTGVPMSEHLGNGWNRLLHPEDRPRAFAAWRDAVEGRGPYDLEYRVRRRDGRYEWFKVIGRPIRDAEGQIVRWFGVAINIEAIKQAQEGLRRLTETLESRVAQRTAELEHRTRQLQKLTLELSQAEDRERRRLADVLHDDLQQQLAAVKFHLGRMSSRTRGDIVLRRTTAQLDQMLTVAIETSRSLSHELSPAMLYQGSLGETLEWLANQIRAKHGLDVHVRTDGEIHLESDTLKAFLYKAAQEMLFNVVKHARVGEARVRVRRVGRCLCLVVSDRGRGFDLQDLKAAAGFGLFSIRERVQLLGGRMRIKSAKGRGSTFFIAVPDSREQRVEDRGLRAEEGDDPFSGPVLRVLVADDHEIVRQGLAALLREQEDIEFVGEAANGREAVDLASRLRPDVVIMDVAMPLMNGDEATRQTKLHLPGTRVIALSMYEEDGMVERMRRAGADCYILKTAPADELLAAVRGKRACA